VRSRDNCCIMLCAFEIMHTGLSILKGLAVSQSAASYTVGTGWVGLQIRLCTQCECCKLTIIPHQPGCSCCMSCVCACHMRTHVPCMINYYTSGISFAAHNVRGVKRCGCCGGWCRGNPPSVEPAHQATRVITHVSVALVSTGNRCHRPNMCV
jgi:hypothetical protein